MRKTIFSIFILLSVSVFGQIPNGYYSSANGLSGEVLWTELHNIIKDPHTESYSQVDERFVSLGTDEDPNNPSNIIFFYMRDSRPSNSFTGNGDGSDFTGGWNKEHIWPRSRGVGDSGNDQQDMHMLRPTDVDVNSRRAALDFGLVSGNNTANGSYFEPHDEVKGDCARILFYMITCYKGTLFLVENVTNSSNQLGNLSLMLEWHEADPVDDFERNRNNKVASYQGNRNPFVDHPEYVNAIWGDGTIGDTPSIATTATGGGYNFGSLAAGETSPSVNYKVTGTNLTGNVTVSVSTPFQVSLNNSTWSTSVQISEANVEANTSNTVYVRFAPTVVNGQTYNANVSHASTGATTVNVPISGTERTVSISTIAQARALGVDTEVSIRGTVSTPDMGNTSGNYYVQDETGGILIYHAGNHDLVEMGDEVEITGVRANYNGILEIEPSLVTVLASGSRPAHASISSADLTVNNARQGMLVRIQGVSLDDAGQWPTLATSPTDVDATSGGTPFVIRLHPTSHYNGSPAPPSNNLTVTGVLTRFDNTVQIMPFVNGDVVASDALPQLSANTSSLVFDEVAINENSAAQAAIVTGSNLTENVTVTTTGDFRVATTAGGTYGTNLSLVPSSGSVNVSIFVRFSPTQVGSREGTITLTSSGEQETISLSGTGTSNASVQLTTTSFNADFGSTNVNSVSASSSYTVAATGLSSNLTITAPDYFRVSLAPTSGYSSSLNIPRVSGAIASTTVYVVFAPGVAGAQSGNITHTSTGASESLFVEGVGAVPLSAEDVPTAIVIHPNPTDGYVEIAGVDWAKTTVRIFDSRGYRLPVRFKEGRINVSDFPAGMYYFTFSGEGQPVVHKVVIR